MNFPAQVECLNLARITAASIRIASGSFGQNLNLDSGLARASGSFCQRCALYRRSGSLGQYLANHASLPFSAPTSAARKHRVKGRHRLSRHCTSLCSYFVLARRSVSRKQNLSLPHLRSQ